jgi:hypothetical protein
MATSTPEEGLVALLRGASGVAAIVSTRIYPQVIPSGETRAAIAYQRISGMPVQHLRGPSGLERPRIQIDCIAANYGEMIRLSEAVKSALDGWRGTVQVTPSDSVRVGVMLVGDRDDYEMETRRHRRSVDFAVWAHD